MSIIKKDPFLISLIRSVSEWYDEWYNDNVILMKELHIEMLVSHYDFNRFKKCNNLHKEKVKFLGEVQEIVNINISNGRY